MERSPLRDFVVGLFVLAGLAAVAYLSLKVGGVQLTRAPEITLYAGFDEIGGLKVRAPVEISGVRVGEVRAITLDEHGRARVELGVDAGRSYPLDTSASIMTSGILGDRYLLLQLGGEDEALKDGETISYTESAVLLERMIGKLIHNTAVGDEGK
jgi:phospholipid/cholesterol/gamma-HCH transport system substrate-binding protein